MKLPKIIRNTITLAGFFMALLFLLSPISPAEDLKSLRGKPFSDPSHVQKMPPEWGKKPVTYDPAIGDADLVISLNQQFSHFLEPLINKYARKNNLKIVVKQGTCGISAGMASGKKGDIVGFCCPPANTDRLPGLSFHTIGIHPVSILVHPDNPVDNLSLDQVRMIFKGDILNWSKVGGKDKSIYAVGRLHCKKRPADWRQILDNEDLFAPELRTVEAIEDMFSLVSSNPDSIGHEVMWMSSENRDKVKTLRINSIRPQQLDHVASGRYPFYRTLNLTTWEAKHMKKTQAGKLIDYLISEVEKISKDADIVPASRLRKAGWKFRGNELVGEPR